MPIFDILEIDTSSSAEAKKSFRPLKVLGAACGGNSVICLKVDDSRNRNVLICGCGEKFKVIYFCVVKYLVKCLCFKICGTLQIKLKFQVFELF